MASRIFINLTSGIEALPLVPDYSFIRISSTNCEQKRWGSLLEDLDYNFLITLVTQNNLSIYDCSSRRSCSRALWQGVPFILFALKTIYLGQDFNGKCLVGRSGKHLHNCSEYFLPIVQKMKVPQKIKYVSRFITKDFVNASIRGITLRSKFDDKYETYRDFLNGVEQLPINEDVLSVRLFT